MFQIINYFSRRSPKKHLSKNSTKWKLYILLALLNFMLTSCGGDAVTQSKNTTTPNQTSSVDSTPVRSLPIADTRPSILILHDSSGDWGYIGKEHAMLLENLLGHFDASIRTQPVTSYRAGQVNQYNTTFYLGTTYDEPAFHAEDSDARKNYDDFLNDVISTSSTVVWINHNLWKLAWNWPVNNGLKDFSGQFGFHYNGLINHQYNRIAYKGQDLNKGVVRFPNPGAVLDGCIEESDGKYDCSGELNKVKIDDPLKVITHASAYSTENALAGLTPYIIQSNNFWFVGDLPFLHHSVEDRYLAFADLLFDMLGEEQNSNTLNAIVRLDNIHPKTDPETLTDVLDYLESERIPYSMAISPLYVDNNDPSLNLTLNDSPIAEPLKKHHSNGLMSVVAHGLSHQWEGGDNPHSGISGDDFEFYKVSKNDDLSLNYENPLYSASDTAQRTLERLAKSRELLGESGLHSFAWTAPEYLAAESDYLIAQEQYPVHYGRLHYFSPNGPDGRFVGQMFPYDIQHDRYDYNVIPENLGGIDPEPPTGYEVVTAEQILANADRLSVVRDHIASFYFDVTQPLLSLKQIIEGLQEREYRFIPPCALGYSCLSSIPEADQLYIDSRSSGKRLDAGANTANTSNDILLWRKTDSVSQAWSVISHENHYMQLKSTKGAKCIAAHSINQSGLEVSLKVCDSNDEHQLWKQYGSDIRNRGNGQCLDAANDNETIVTSACDNRESQQWQMHWE